MTTRAQGLYTIDLDASAAKQSLSDFARTSQAPLQKVGGAINSLAGQVGGLGGAFSGVLGVAKNFGEAFLAGGPVGVGIAVGAVAIGKLAESWRASEKAAEEALEKTRETVERVANEINGLTEGLNKQIIKLAGVDEAELAFEKQRQKVAELNEEIEDLVDTGFTKWAQALKGTGSDVNFGNAQEKFNEQLSFMRSRLEDESFALIEASDKLEEHRSKLALVERLTNRVTVAKTKSAKAIKEEKKEVKAASRAFEEDMARIERDIAFETKEAKIRAAQEAHDKRRELDRQMHDEERASAMRAIEEKKNKEKEYRDAVEEYRRQSSEREKEMIRDVVQVYIDLTQGALMMVFDSTIDVLEKIAAKEEINAVQIAAAFMKSIGRQLFGIGLTQTFEGAGHIIRGAISSDPRAIAGGVGLVALGNSAMAAGAALAGGGAVIAGANRASTSTGGGGGGGGSSRMVGSRRERDDDRGVRDSGVTIVFGPGSAALGDPTNRALTLDRDARRARANVW
jgi:hypothetical protein